MKKHPCVEENPSRAGGELGWEPGRAGGPMQPRLCPPICWQLRGEWELLQVSSWTTRTLVPNCKTSICCHVTVLLGFAHLARAGPPTALAPGAGCSAEGTGGFVSISCPESVFTPSF